MSTNNLTNQSVLFTDSTHAMSSARVVEFAKAPYQWLPQEIAMPPNV
jgi:hypothetical protein